MPHLENHPRNKASLPHSADEERWLFGDEPRGVVLEASRKDPSLSLASEALLSLMREGAEAGWKALLSCHREEVLSELKDAGRAAKRDFAATMKGLADIAGIKSPGWDFCKELHRVTESDIETAAREIAAGERRYTHGRDFIESIRNPTLRCLRLQLGMWEHGFNYERVDDAQKVQEEIRYALLSLARLRHELGPAADRIGIIADRRFTPEFNKQLYCDAPPFDSALEKQLAQDLLDFARRGGDLGFCLGRLEVQGDSLAFVLDHEALRRDAQRNRLAESE